MIEVKVEGLDEVIDNLKNLQKKLSDLEGEHTTEINKEIFEDIPDDDFDKYIKDNTDFQSWKDMLQTSTNEYTKRKLRL